jgi:TctA family transporter
VLGLILGQLGESSVAKSMQLLSYDPLRLFTRPIAAVLLTLAILTVAYNLYQAVRASPSRKEAARS